MTTSMIRALSAAALVAAFALAAGAQPPAPAPVPASTVTVPEMDCAGCAKQLGGALLKVPGVAKAEYDVKARTIKLTHKPGETPSPKALWEAVEKQDKAPTKLETPAGTHTKKPAA